MEASLRSSWSSPDQDRWDSRHHVLYSNSRLHPNFRSYFDRRVLRREELEELGVEHPSAIKPSWRLSTEGLQPEERKAQDTILHSTGPCATPHIGDTVALAQPSTFSIPGSIHDPNCISESDAIPSALKAVGSRQPTNNAFIWNGRHHIVWCNERNTSGKKLNPVQLRCYFDRMRLPHNCRCEVPVKNVRIMPNWRLRTDPATGNDSRDGDSILAGNVQSRQVEKNERNWNTQHELLFQNGHLSRLDRSYFDRWLEPDSDLKRRSDVKGSSSPGKRVVRVLKPTWSLDREGSPDRTAKELLRNTASRHEPSGKWNPRHQRFFVNNIHTNLKSYFDRSREPEELHGAKKKKNSGLSNLKVDWSLQELGCLDYPPTLRSNSVPALSKAGTRKHNQKPSWFSSHGVIFLSQEEHSQMEAEERKGNGVAGKGEGRGRGGKSPSPTTSTAEGQVKSELEAKCKEVERLKKEQQKQKQLVAKKEEAEASKCGAAPAIKGATATPKAIPGKVQFKCNPGCQEEEEEE